MQCSQEKLHILPEEMGGGLAIVFLAKYRV